jgi:16S rRNA (guanine966-N2)-methyltransferase
MRVIAGEFGRRKLIAPKGETTRPTPDRLRESLFSILGEAVVGVPFTDFYCGSGSVGLEALSRGASRCTFIEKDKAALEALRGNLAALGLGARAEVVAKPVGAVLAQRRWEGIVFVDPPYDAESEYENCLLWLGKSPAELVMVQHNRRFNLPESIGRLKRSRQLKQGDNWVSFYFVGEGSGTD